jgi:hypothetical protein
MGKPMKFYHYACQHSVGSILKDKGTLRPNQHAGRQPLTEARAKSWGLGEQMVWVYPVVWVTDVDVHDRGDAMLVGLGQVEGNMTDCFRVEFRFIVPNVGLRPWKDWADANVPVDLAQHRRFLETGLGVDPARWWVSDKPISGCRLDQGYHGMRDQDWGPIGQQGEEEDEPARGPRAPAHP